MSMKTLATIPDARPVQLQINNSGAWKIIASFDAGDDESADKARAAGQLLGELGGKNRTTLRIATDQAVTQVLARWDTERGWFEVDSKRQRDE